MKTPVLGPGRLIWPSVFILLQSNWPAVVFRCFPFHSFMRTFPSPPAWPQHARSLLRTSYVHIHGRYNRVSFNSPEFIFHTSVLKEPAQSQLWNDGMCQSYSQRMLLCLIVPPQACLTCRVLPPTPARHGFFVGFVACVSPYHMWGRVILPPLCCGAKPQPGDLCWSYCYFCMLLLC